MEIVLVCHDIRSTYNIGSLLRTADGFAVKTVYCCGITPYIGGSDRPPHVRSSNLISIAKTALGAEKTVNTIYSRDILILLEDLRSKGFEIVALEQSKLSVLLKDYKPTSNKIAVVLGTETVGLSDPIINMSDVCIEIPMYGKKESFNVSVAAAITLYELRRG